MGRAIFDPPPTESTRLNGSPKYFFTGNYVGDPYSCAKFDTNTPMGASRQMGEIKKITYLFICLFIPCSGTHLQVRPVDGFSRLMAQSTRTRARMCLLGDLLILLLTLGVIYPKKQSGGRE